MAPPAPGPPPSLYFTRPRPGRRPRGAKGAGGTKGATRGAGEGKRRSLLAPADQPCLAALEAGRALSPLPLPVLAPSSQAPSTSQAPSSSPPWPAPSTSPPPAPLEGQGVPRSSSPGLCGGLGLLTSVQTNTFLPFTLASGPTFPLASAPWTSTSLWPFPVFPGFLVPSALSVCQPCGPVG